MKKGHLLDQLPDLINKTFAALELLVIRITLIALSILGAYRLIID